MEHISFTAEAVKEVVILLLVAVIVRVITKPARLPFSIALVVVGMSLASLERFAPATAAFVPHLQISPDLIFFIFLPTLVFESAFNMDTRMLRANLSIVLGLAAPGLLLSTTLIGLIVHMLTPAPLPEALLLGAILSATDPVAVVSLFKQLGAPRRLTTLVEGESLFNDATAIVVSRILIAIVAAGDVSGRALAGGALEFFTVFFGGLLTGGALGVITGLALGRVETDSFVEISLTTTLAYLSFYLAEAWLGVSGVMATVAAGLTMASWGRMKISPAVRGYLSGFWDYLAAAATAIIFLLVGLQIDLWTMAESAGLLAVTVTAMLASRAAVVYGLVPAVTRFSGEEAVGRNYQTILYWGGLRGAIALAIAFSLPPFALKDDFIAVVAGAVLFTLLAQGLSMNLLVRLLGLDKPPLPDRFARVEGLLAAKKHALERIPDLQAGGQFSGSIGERLKRELAGDMAGVKEKLDRLRESEMDREVETRLLFLVGFAEEKSLYLDMFNKGHLTERSFRELVLGLNLQNDAIRHGYDHTAVSPHHMRLRKWERRLVSWLDRTRLLAPLAERLRTTRIALDYEESWGHYQGSCRVIELMRENPRLGVFSAEAVEEVTKQYRQWRDAARRQLDQHAEEYPEFVNAMQERLGRRLLLLAEEEEIGRRSRRGELPEGVARDMERDIEHGLGLLRGLETEKLKVEPLELLKKAAILGELKEKEFAHLAGKMRSHTFAIRDVIVNQGERGDSLYLIARGVVRVTRRTDGGSRDLATLVAGDFFGEMALLHGEPRQATVWAVTPCSLFELTREDLEQAMAEHPGIRAAMEEADRRRKADL